MKRTKYIIENDIKRAQSNEEDLILIRVQLMINYALQILRLIVVIFQGTFFLSMIWANFCDFFLENLDLKDEESFTAVNDLEPFKEATAMTIILKVCYYMFTTMSTVGFGDMHPLNSAERIMCAINMIMGVSVFSLVISMF